MTQRRSQFGTPSVWVALKKFPHPAGRICGCLLIVFQPVTKHGPAGLKLRVVETVVNACRAWHAGTAMQPDDRGKRACTLGLGQIPLYAVAQNEAARNVPLSRWRSAFKLYALQRRGARISHQRTYDAP